MDLIEELAKHSMQHAIVAEIVSSQTQIADDERIRLRDMFREFRAAQLGDDNFIDQFSRHPNRMYWELMLGCLLKDAGQDVRHVSPGPDFKLLRSNGAIWVEATAPEPGDPSKPDSVPAYNEREAYWYPSEAIEKRVTDAFSKKLDQWDKSWSQVIGAKDIFVLAINTCNLGLYVAGHDLAKALFGIGPLTVRVRNEGDDATEVIDQFFSYEPVVRKLNGEPINKNGFRDGTLRKVSALLHGHFNVNWPKEAARHHVSIYHNPTATNSLPSGSLGFGREFAWESQAGSFRFVQVRQ